MSKEHVSSYQPDPDIGRIRMRLGSIIEDLSVARNVVASTKIAFKISENKYKVYRSQRRQIVKLVNHNMTIPDIEAAIDLEERVQELWREMIDLQAEHEIAKANLDTLDDEFTALRKEATLLTQELSHLGG